MSAGTLISVIDDDESMRIAIVALVQSEGYEARGFASAEEFLRCGSVQSFDCVITDIQMPGMSGIELKWKLAACNCAVPVIMITARQELDLEERALASGAVSFLKKPFEADVLIACLEKAVKT